MLAYMVRQHAREDASLGEQGSSCGLPWSSEREKVEGQGAALGRGCCRGRGQQDDVLRDSCRDGTGASIDLPTQHTYSCIVSLMIFDQVSRMGFHARYSS